MKKQALYRRFRSKTFSELIGQSPIATTLSRQVEARNPSHAYLFCGTRGTGKTSTALILAKAVNCLSPTDGNPCGICDICTLQSNPDVWEIDAASNNGVDQIRELRENVRFAPLESKYKVYIIDEVHMLTSGAFNALLKTLEEPPKHVIFILATTEPEKLPATILSRVQRFDFRRIKARDIADHLKNIIAKEENTTYEEAAIEKISILGDGSMRDALSILDNCLSFSGGNLTLDSVNQTVGSLDSSTRFELVSAMLQADPASALVLLDKSIQHGSEIYMVVRDVAEHLRSLVIVSTADSAAQDILEISSEELSRYQAQSKETNIHTVLRILDNFSYLPLEIKRSVHGRILAESAIVKASMVPSSQNISSLIERIADLESRLESGNFNARPISAPFESNSTPQVENPHIAKSIITTDNSSQADNISLIDTTKADVLSAEGQTTSELVTDSSSDNSEASEIFEALKNSQNEGVKQIFSMYKWDANYNNNTLVLTPPKNAIPALISSLRAKETEFSGKLDNKYPGIKIEFATKPAGSSVSSTNIKGKPKAKTLTDKVTTLFGSDNI